MREALLVAAVPLEVGLGDPVAQLGQPLALLREGVLQRDDLAILQGGRLPDGGGGAEVAVLVEHRDAEVGLARDRTAGGLHEAGHEAEQRGLAGAVAADDAPALAGGHGEGDVPEQRGSAELHGDVGQWRG